MRTIVLCVVLAASAKASPKLRPANPEARLFAHHDNPTSYSFGYAWPARSLFFWTREEIMVRYGIYWPFFLNIYGVFSMLF